MGLCISSAGAAARDAPRKAATATVLLPTGELREYPRHATAARALEDAGGGKGWFLCDADGMGFEGPVSAVPCDEELRAGQIYFVLPADARRRGLRREEVAALAVKACAALARAAASSSGTGTRRRRSRRGSVAPLVFSPPPEVEVADDETSSTTAVTTTRKALAAAEKNSRPRRPHHRRFASDLSAIPECESEQTRQVERDEDLPPRCSTCD